ncbi:MAG: transcription elongation factor GreA [Patescibacteria group bacterium]|jgi:transcription elongation factor GreA
MDQLILTSEGLDKLKKELEESMAKRKVIAGKIEHAKSLGDLSENFEYQEAKEDQSFNETRILELEDMIKRAVVSGVAHKGGTINLGSKIKVKINDKLQEFKIVSFNEADPVKGLISNESPLGQAFLGRLVGDKFEVVIPRGKMVCEIIAVE